MDQPQPRWHLEEVDPDVDEAPPGSDDDCAGLDDEDQG